MTNWIAYIQGGLPLTKKERVRTDAQTSHPVPDWDEPTYRAAYIGLLNDITRATDIEKLRWVALNRLFAIAAQNGDAEAMLKYDAERNAVSVNIQSQG